MDNRGMYDTRGLSDPVLGQFVRVVSGPHKGRYGTFHSLAPNGEDAVLRTRDNRTDLLSVKVTDLRRSKAGLR